MSVVWRVCARKHARRASQGGGAQKWGGRWNPAGTPIVYCSGSLSLACLEVLVHAEAEELPSGLVAIPAEIPDSVKLQRLQAADLSADWRQYPAPESLQRLGLEWIQSGRSCVLSVPSAVIPIEENFLLNPLHPDFARIRIHPPQPFSLDPRLWKASRARG